MCGIFKITDKQYIEGAQRKFNRYACGIIAALFTLRSVYINGFVSDNMVVNLIGLAVSYFITIWIMQFTMGKIASLIAPKRLFISNDKYLIVADRSESGTIVQLDIEELSENEYLQYGRGVCKIIIHGTENTNCFYAKGISKKVIGNSIIYNNVPQNK